MTPIFTPFPLPEIQHPKNIEQSILWLKDTGLVQHHEHARKIAYVGAEYINYCYPYIQPHQIQDMIDLSSWICIIDDHVENETTANNLHSMISFLNAIKYLAEEPGFKSYPNLNLFKDNTLVQTLAELKTRINQWTTPSLMRDLMNSVSHFVSGLIWELSIRANEDITPDLNLFCAVRINASGMYISKSIMQCIQNILLPQTLIDQPLFRALTQSILFVCVLDNDIYSYHKERESGLKYSNVVDIILLNNSVISQEEALSQTIDLRNKCLQCYMELKKKYRHDDDLKRYLTGLENIIAGNLVFGFTNDRYKVAHTEMDFQFSTQNPTHSSPPHEIPSIAWWWEYLESENTLRKSDATAQTV